MSAFKDYDNKTAVPVSDKYVCELNLTEDRYFDAPFDFPWKGSFEKRKATWEAHDIETALGLFWEVHNYMKKVEEFNAK